MLSFFVIALILAAGCTNTPASTPSLPRLISSPNQTSAYVPASPVTPARESQRDQNVNTIRNIVEEYHQTHTYSLLDMYACAQMSQDVWDMVETKGINATIRIGKIDQDITSIQKSDHAWVMAEVSPGEDLAMETTGGYLVCSDPSVCAVNNSRYYTGWSFATPKDLQDYLKNVPCTSGYILGNDSQCHPACGGTTYCIGTDICVSGECRSCNPGYIMGQDLQCHPVCGSGNSYCTGTDICVSGECRSCNPGYIMGQDLQCHPACGGTTYCTGTDICVNGECRSCNPGYIIGQDLQCHPVCGSGNSYCTGDNVCINGQCMYCAPGYYPGTDLQCHKS